MLVHCELPLTKNETGVFYLWGSSGNHARSILGGAGQTLGWERDDPKTPTRAYFISYGGPETRENYPTEKRARISEKFKWQSPKGRVAKDRLGKKTNRESRTSRMCNGRTAKQKKIRQIIDLNGNLQERKKDRGYAKE